MTTDPRTVPAALDRLALQLPDHPALITEECSFTAEAEQVLARMERVADAAVIGVSDQRLGEVGRAFLVTRPGADLDKDSVIAYTREYLANFNTPRSVRFVDALPRNAGGKVVESQLREQD